MDINVSEMDLDSLKALRSKIDAILDGPNDKIGSLDDAVTELKRVKDRVASVGKVAVTKAVKGLMDAFPEVKAVRWNQYTPYFNDGDACEFSVHKPRVLLEGADEDGGDYGDGYEESWSLGYNAEKAGKPKPKALMKAMKELGSVMESAEDAMKATFGDHVQVTILRGVDTAEVEEYDHD